MKTLFDDIFDNKADYTFKYNTNLGRHGWLRLTPAYSVKLVNDLLKDSNLSHNILDPFSGTATTGLVAAEKGFTSVLFEINPFLIWFGNAKSQNYSIEQINKLKSDFSEIIMELIFDEIQYWVPPIHNIERWWNAETLQILAKLRNLITLKFGEPTINNSANLLWITFCRLIIETSSADFNHVSMSFKDNTYKYDIERVISLFTNIFNHIINSALSEIKGKTTVYNVDARNPENMDIKFDRVITSPPYPNRISYIRELRPYMYWTKFLVNGSDAGELDWKAIGGTWGIATSRLKNWTPNNKELPEMLYKICNEIKQKDNSNSELMSLYVHKFFDDIFEHLKNVRNILAPNAKLNYIIGNSSFYSVFVPTDLILSQIFKELNFNNIKAEPIRKRNSKKGLIEYCVSAEWNN